MTNKPAWSSCCGFVRSLAHDLGALATEQREAATALLEELGGPPMSRTTFWRTLKELERDGLVTLETGGTGESSRVAMDDLPASYLTTLVEERLGRGRARKP